MSADLLTPETPEAPAAPERSGGVRGAELWRRTWPKLLAVGIALLLWELIYLSGWKPPYLFASPWETFGYLAETVVTPRFWVATSTTVTRAVAGFGLALVIGTLIGIAVAQSRILRSGVGALITSLLTMPSIVWFPFAIMVFGLRQEAIFFVIVIGAAPSIANGVITGIAEIQPSLLRAGHMLGARGIARYRYVVVPAAMPAYVAGMSQGWAFAWRSLMAGELLVAIPGLPALGSDLNHAGDLGTSAQLFGLMLVILVIGILASSLFNAAAEFLRRRRGLTGFRAPA
jgi:NitT/TauT family transport system permease protein